MSAVLFSGRTDVPDDVPRAYCSCVDVHSLSSSRKRKLERSACRPPLHPCTPTARDEPSAMFVRWMRTGVVTSAPNGM